MSNAVLTVKAGNDTVSIDLAEVVEAAMAARREGELLGSWEVTLNGQPALFEPQRPADADEWNGFYREGLDMLHYALFNAAIEKVLAVENAIIELKAKYDAGRYQRHQYLDTLDYLRELSELLSQIELPIAKRHSVTILPPADTEDAESGTFAIPRAPAVGRTERLTVRPSRAS